MIDYPTSCVKCGAAIITFDEDGLIVKMENGIMLDKEKHYCKECSKEKLSDREDK